LGTCRGKQVLALGLDVREILDVIVSNIHASFYLPVDGLRPMNKGGQRPEDLLLRDMPLDTLAQILTAATSAKKITHSAMMSIVDDWLECSEEFNLNSDTGARRGIPNLPLWIA
jgi:hypothetical protein